jgi:hypothetical protein
MSNTVKFQSLDHPVNLENIVTPPNVSTVEELIQYVNGDDLVMAMSSLIGKLIEPGKIGIIDYNGKIQLIGPGRYMCPNPRATIESIRKLTENPIQYETLTIVRVKPGEYALALDEGRPIILGEGLHVRNSRLFNYVSIVAMNNAYINHGNILQPDPSSRV